MPEPLGPRACFVCGSSNNVKMCDPCGVNWYCSKDCQAVHWEAGHEHLCTQIAELGAALAAAAPPKPAAVLIDNGVFGWFWHQPERVFPPQE